MNTMNTKIEELRCGDVRGFAVRSGIKAGAEDDPLAELAAMESTLKTEGPEAGGSIRA